MAVAQAEVPHQNGTHQQHSNISRGAASAASSRTGPAVHPVASKHMSQHTETNILRHTGVVDLMGVLDSSSDSDAFDLALANIAPSAPLRPPANATAAPAAHHSSRQHAAPLQALPRNGAPAARWGVKAHSAPPLSASASFSSTEGGAAATAAAAAMTRRYATGLTGTALAAPRSRVFRGGSKWVSAEREGGVSAPASAAGTPLAHRAVAPARPPVVSQSPRLSLLDMSAEAPPAPPPSLPVAPNPWAASVQGKASNHRSRTRRNSASSTADPPQSTPPSGRRRGGARVRIQSASPLKSQGSPPPPAVQYNGLYLPGLSDRTRNTWVFPVHEKYAERKYQRAIVATALFQNTLVSLPTGLGKTFIASVVMYNYFRWFPAGQVVFLAPTKPLVVQQVEACYKITGLPATATAVLCGGSVKPEQRTRVWAEKRVVFATPQTLAKDLEAGRCAPERITLLVLDEAHRAQGGYAYCTVVRFMFETHDRARILALSATPGRDAATVQAVVENLRISAVEARTEFDDDVAPYTHAKTIDKVTVPSSAELDGLLARFQACLKPNIARLSGMGLLPVKDAKRVTVGMLREAEAGMWAQAKAGRLDEAACADAKSRLAVLHSLVPAGKELGTHGTYAFWTRVQRFLNSAPQSPGRSSLTSHPQWRMLCSQLASLDAGGRHLVHPKLLVLRNTLEEHFSRAASAGKSTRAIVFTQTRASVDEIMAYLKRKAANSIHAAPFVGQASSGGGSSSSGGGDGGAAAAAGVATKGQTQREQATVIAAFRAGTTNTLVATCIGEEGLDIGEVGVIVMFDAVGSPIRTVQRLGRTGRSGAGACVALVAPGAEARKFDSAFKEYRRVAAFLKDAASRLRMWQPPQEGGAGGLSVTDSSGQQPRMERRSLTVAALRMSQVQGGDQVGGGRAAAAAPHPDTPSAAEADFLAQWMGKGVIDPPAPLLSNGRLVDGMAPRVSFKAQGGAGGGGALQPQPHTPFQDSRRRITTPATVPRPAGRTPQPPAASAGAAFGAHEGAFHLDLAADTPTASGGSRGGGLHTPAGHVQDDSFDDDVLLQLVGDAEAGGGAPAQGGARAVSTQGFSGAAARSVPVAAAAAAAGDGIVEPPLERGIKEIGSGYALQPPYHTNPEHAPRTRLWRDCVLHGLSSRAGRMSLTQAMRVGRMVNGPSDTPPDAYGVIMSPASTLSGPTRGAGDMSARGPSGTKRRCSSLSLLLESFTWESSALPSACSGAGDTPKPTPPPPQPKASRNQGGAGGVIQILDDDSDGPSSGDGGVQQTARPQEARRAHPPSSQNSPPLAPIQWPDTQDSDAAGGLDFDAADVWLTQAAQAPETLQGAVHPPPSSGRGGGGLSALAESPEPPLPRAPAGTPKPAHASSHPVNEHDDPPSPPLQSASAPSLTSAESSLLGAGLSGISGGGGSAPPPPSGAASSLTPVAIALMFPQDEADVAVGGLLQGARGGGSSSAAEPPPAVSVPASDTPSQIAATSITLSTQKAAAHSGGVADAPRPGTAPRGAPSTPSSPAGLGGGTWGTQSLPPSPIPVLGTQTQPEHPPASAASPPVQFSRASVEQEGVAGKGTPLAPPLHATGTIFAATCNSSGLASQHAPPLAKTAPSPANTSHDDSVVLQPPRRAVQGGTGGGLSSVAAPSRVAAVSTPGTAAPILDLGSDSSASSEDDSTVFPPRAAAVIPPRAAAAWNTAAEHRAAPAAHTKVRKPSATRNRFLDMSAEAEGGSEDEDEGGSENEYDLEDSFIHKSTSQGGAEASQAEVSINHAALNAELNHQVGAWGRMFGSRAGAMPMLAAALAAAEAASPPSPPRRSKKKGCKGGRYDVVGGRRRLRAVVLSDSDTSGEAGGNMAPPPARKQARGPTNDDSDSFIVHDVTAALDSQPQYPAIGGAHGAPLNLSFGGGFGLHHGFACDGCGLSPIVGTRFTCTVCAEFDLCEKCMPHKSTLHDLALSGASDGGPPHPFRAVAAPLARQSAGSASSGSPPAPLYAAASAAAPPLAGAARPSASSSSGSDAFQPPPRTGLAGAAGELNTSAASGGSSGSVFDPLPPPAPRASTAFPYTLPTTSTQASEAPPPQTVKGGFNLLHDDSDSEGESLQALPNTTAAPSPAAVPEVPGVPSSSPTLPRVYLAAAGGRVCTAVHDILQASSQCTADAAWGDLGGPHGLLGPPSGWCVWSREDLAQVHSSCEGGVATILQTMLHGVPSVVVFLTELPGTNIPAYMQSADGAVCAQAISALRNMGPAGVRVLVKRSPADVAMAILAAVVAGDGGPPLPPLPRLTAPPGDSHPPSERKLAAQARFLQQRKGLAPATAVAVACAAEAYQGGLTALLRDLAKAHASPLAREILGGADDWRAAVCTALQ